MITIQVSMVENTIITGVIIISLELSLIRIFYQLAVMINNWVKISQIYQS